jgi:hypothetical protein
MRQGLPFAVKRGGMNARTLHTTPCCLDVYQLVAEASSGERCRTRLRASDNMRVR